VCWNANTAIPDDPTLQAVMYGPLVLAGRLGKASLTADNLRAEPTKPRTVPEYKSEPVAAPNIVARSSDPAGWLVATGRRPTAGISHRRPGRGHHPYAAEPRVRRKIRGVLESSHRLRASVGTSALP
jgi:hypothetical protein